MLVKKVIIDLKNKFMIYRYYCRIKKSKKNIFVFGAPFHSNMGDQAQSYCIKKWLNKNYPEYNVWIFETSFVSALNYKLLDMIKKVLQKEDMIFLHSGYHTTDLYMFEENMQREVVKKFDNRTIVFFPQTIYYEDKKQKEIASNLYNKHNHIFLCRDNVSYEIAQKMFPKAQLCKYPDIVTTLIGTHHYNYERQGILMCLRNDKEAYYSKQQYEELRKKLIQYGPVDITDTTLDIDIKDIRKNRENILEDIFKKYAHYKLIITDRYHGTIFSMISNTPVLVLSSTDHKLKSGVQWFPDSFNDYIKYVESFDSVLEEVQKVFEKNYTYKLPDYFNETYYNKLKGLLQKDEPKM